jgi:divalent metal cation (Fe/Co/Zn/Cd) transporter
MWWAAAAGFISLSTLMDGLRSVRTSVVELIDGAPRGMDSGKIEPLVNRVAAKL